MFEKLKRWSLERKRVKLLIMREESELSKDFVTNLNELPIPEKHIDEIDRIIAQISWMLDDWR